jgi:hypothetical protein
MAYREIAMWEILEVLRRVHRGEPQRASSGSQPWSNQPALDEDSRNALCGFGYVS